MAFTKILLSLLTFYTISIYAVITVTGGTPAQQQAVNAAIDEAITIANDVLAKLSIYTGDNQNYVDAALQPLFDRTDLNPISMAYLALRRVKTSATQIRFYLDENHITWSDSKNSWTDTEFTYINKDGNRRNIKIPITGSQANKPGVVGSYTLLGYKFDEIDFSNQAHIFISQKRLNPTEGEYDSRSLTDIKTNGFLQNRNFLDGIKPLSETIIHELMHVVGGTAQPNHARPVISDGPQVYGYSKCVLHKQNAAAVLLNPMTKLADPLMLVGKMLYLQIDNPRNDPTWWTTGEVDPVTLRPLNVPPPLAKRRRRHSL